MDFRKIRSFLAVAEGLSYSRAARELYVSHSSVTQHIKALEEELGFPLLDRSRVSVALTREGEIMLRTFRTMLAQYETGLGEARKAQLGREALTVAWPCSPYWMNMPELIRRIRQKYQVTVRTKVSKSNEMLREFRRGDVDLIFCNQGRLVPEESVLITPLFHVGFHVILRPERPLSSAKAIRPDELIDEDVFCAEGSPGDSCLARLNDAIRACGIDASRLITVPHREDVLSAVATGQGVGLAPADLPFGEEGGLKTVPFDAHKVYIPYACAVRAQAPAPIPALPGEAVRFFGKSA